MNKPFDWDVFLSHSSIDKPRVARLAERLKAAGFRIWFDRPNIDSGEDIVTAIEQGLERSRVLILCMTKAAFESEWVLLERNTATRHNSAHRTAISCFPSIRVESTSNFRMVRVFIASPGNLVERAAFKQVLKEFNDCFAEGRRVQAFRAHGDGGPMMTSTARLHHLDRSADR